ncbi:hypothetical protein Efla_003000 [Eimeria flavescens]
MGARAGAQRPLLRAPHQQQQQQQLQQEQQLQQQLQQQQQLLQDDRQQEMQHRQQRLQQKQQSATQDSLLLQHEQQLPLLDAVSSEQQISSSSSSENLKLAGCICLFLVGYCGQPILVDFCRFQGVASASTFIFLLPHYLGMMLAGSLPIAPDAHTPQAKAQLRNPRLWRRVLRLSVIDLAHQLLEKAGLVLCGSGVYILLSSTSIVWTAALSALILGRQFSPLQVFSLCLIVVGVSIKASNVTLNFSSEESLGMLLSLAAAVLQGLTFVLNERFLDDRKEPISGLNLVFMMGSISSLLLLIWTCVWTLPQLDSLLLSRVRAQGGDLRTIALLLSLLLLCGLLHSATMWYIILRLGAVTSGALKGCKAAAVIALSHILFCSVQETQCVDMRKGLAAVLCIGGVVLHSILPAPPPQPVRLVSSSSSSGSKVQQRFRFLHARCSLP